MLICNTQQLRLGQAWHSHRPGGVRSQLKRAHHDSINYAPPASRVNGFLHCKVCMIRTLPHGKKEGGRAGHHVTVHANCHIDFTFFSRCRAATVTAQSPLDLGVPCVSTGKRQGL